MTLFDSKEELISLKDQNNSKINPTSEKDPILCNHCKRTASNGVRCLGMCVADNDYLNNSNFYINNQMKIINKSIKFYLLINIGYYLSINKEKIIFSIY